MIVDTSEAANLGARSLGRACPRMGKTRPGDLTVVAAPSGRASQARTHRLFGGKPIIQKGKRGPTPRWRNPRKPTKTVIHVNTHKIKQNQIVNLDGEVTVLKK